MIGVLQTNGRVGRSDWRTLKLTAVDGSPNLLSVTIGRLLVRNIKTRDLASSQKTHSAISPVTTSFAVNVLDFADHSPKCDVAYFFDRQRHSLPLPWLDRSNGVAGWVVGDNRYHLNLGCSFGRGRGICSRLFMASIRRS